MKKAKSRRNVVKISATIKLVLTALFMGLTIVATMFIRIPLPLGYVNLGDMFVLLAVFVLGPVYGTIAGGIGSALADLFGYITYTPGTLIVKSAMALVAYFTYKGILKLTKKSIIGEIVGGIAGIIVMAFGYFVYEIIFFETSAVAIVNVPWNLLQGAIGVALSTIVMRILSTTKVLDKLKK